MTKNQHKLLLFISNYRLKHDNSPTFKEMVDGIGVSDNKSLLGVIDNLISQGFLIKDSRKSRSVFLTDKAIRYLGLTPLPINYKKYQNSRPSDSLKLPNKVPINSVTVTLPSDNNAYLGKGLNTNGTTLNEVKSIVEAAVSLTLSNYTNGTYPKDSKSEIINGIASLLSKMLNSGRFAEKLEWATLLIILSGFSVLILGKNIFAIETAIIYIFIIFIINNLPKK